MANVTMINPFEEIDALREMFGGRPGSVIETRKTYVPTGKIRRIWGWNNTAFMEVWGSRTFPADRFDWMVEWMGQHAPQDLLALQIVEMDLLK